MTNAKQNKSKGKDQGRGTPVATAEVIREYGPYPGIQEVAGVTFDGTNIWCATGDGLAAIDPTSGEVARKIAVAAEAGTAFDGEYLWQLAGDRIQKIDPHSGRVISTIPAPGQGCDSGLTWAEGTLWVGEYRARKIRQIDAETGAVLRTIESDRFVTGVSWANDELWHATLEEERSEIRRVDPQTGKVLERMELPAGIAVSGLEAGRGGVFYCGGTSSGKVRAVRKRKS
jgi:glutamine cyclotransferase